MSAELSVPNGWRAATAVRVFVLALSVGQALSTGTLGQVSLVVMAITVIGVTAAAVDTMLFSGWARWLPIPEALVGSLVLGVTPYVGAATPLLAGPMVAAGIRGGPWSLVTTFVASLLALVASRQVTDTGFDLTLGWPWLAVGLGAGFLAVRQSRRTRATGEHNRPSLEARRLLSQLRDLSGTSGVGLDAVTIAQEITTLVASVSPRTDVWVAHGAAEAGPNILASSGAEPIDVPKAADALAKGPRPGQLWPIGDPANKSPSFVYLDPPVEGDALELIRDPLESKLLSLEAALMFDDIRQMATTEERARLARDIHDGAAQDVAALGYAIDSLTTEDNPPPGLTDLRQEVSRVVAELRHSVFELRQTEAGFQLRSELARLMDQVARETSMETQFACADSVNQLPVATQRQLFAIAREAVTNSRHHSGASRLSLRCQASLGGYELVVQDDGTTGVAEAKPDHYGITSMRERAEQLGAAFSLTTGKGQGTTVRVTFQGAKQ